MKRSHDQALWTKLHDHLGTGKLALTFQGDSEYVFVEMWKLQYAHSLCTARTKNSTCSYDGKEPHAGAM